MRRQRILAAALAIVSAASHPALAQDAAGDAALAEQLFQEAQVLLREKRYEEACPKFQESQHLDPGGGTLFQLATCHTLTGKTASAWAEFGEVALLAKQRNRPDIERAAREQLQSLEPKLSRLVIVVPDDVRIEGLSVRRDGTILGEAALGTAMAVDPGQHRISAAAPGHETWSTTVELGSTADLQTVTIRPLAETPEPEHPGNLPAPATAAREASSSKYSPVLLYGTLGVGVAGIGVATFFGIRSYTKERDARKTCPDTACNDPAAVAASEEAVTSANIANVAGAVGLVAFGVATYLFLTNKTAASGKSKSALRLAPSSVSPLSMGLEGRF